MFFSSADRRRRTKIRRRRRRRRDFASFLFLSLSTSDHDPLARHLAPLGSPRLPGCRPPRRRRAGQGRGQRGEGRRRGVAARGAEREDRLLLLPLVLFRLLKLKLLLLAAGPESSRGRRRRRRRRSKEGGPPRGRRRIRGRREGGLCPGGCRGRGGRGTGGGGGGRVCRFCGRRRRRRRASRPQRAMRRRRRLVLLRHRRSQRRRHDAKVRVLCPALQVLLSEHAADWGDYERRRRRVSFFLFSHRRRRRGLRGFFDGADDGVATSAEQEVRRRWGRLHLARFLGPETLAWKGIGRSSGKSREAEARLQSRCDDFSLKPIGLKMKRRRSTLFSFFLSFSLFPFLFSRFLFRELSAGSLFLLPERCRRPPSATPRSTAGETRSPATRRRPHQVLRRRHRR